MRRGCTNQRKQFIRRSKNFEFSARYALANSFESWVRCEGTLVAVEDWVFVVKGLHNHAAIGAAAGWTCSPGYWEEYPYPVP